MDMDSGCRLTVGVGAGETGESNGGEIRITSRIRKE